MRTKQIILVVTLLLPFLSIKGQFLHIGIKAFNTPYQKMSFYQYDINDYVYYFANEYNETIRFNGFQASETNSYVPFPSLYVRYEKGNNLFFQFDVFARWSSNEAKYENSVDFAEYADVFNPESELENLGYNSIKLKWAFLGNSLTAGYTFLKTKTLRPYVFGGISAYYLMSLKPGDYYEDTRSIRNGLIFRNLNTFRTVTFYYRGGLGLKYHGLSLDVYFENNILPIDKYSDSEDDSNQYYDNRPNYKNLATVNVALSLNLLSFNLIKKQSLK